MDDEFWLEEVAFPLLFGIPFALMSTWVMAAIVVADPPSWVTAHTWLSILTAAIAALIAAALYMHEYLHLWPPLALVAAAPQSS